MIDWHLIVLELMEGYEVIYTHHLIHQYLSQSTYVFIYNQAKLGLER